MEKVCGIYKITSPSGKIYIGESVNINRRKYFYSTFRCKNQVKLYNSLKKYGWDLHVFELIEECCTTELKCRERHWQDFYDVLGENGLNCKLTECGELKQVHSEEVLNKMRVPKPNMRGENHPNWKKPMSENSKTKLSKSQKIRFIKNPNLGKNISLLSSGKNHRQYGIPIPDYQKDIIRNCNSKIVLCVNTGLFYSSALEASIVYCFKYSTLRSMLNGNCKNKTSLIYC